MEVKLIFMAHMALSAKDFEEQEMFLQKAGLL